MSFKCKHCRNNPFSSIGVQFKGKNNENVCFAIVSIVYYRLFHKNILNHFHIYKHCKLKHLQIFNHPNSYKKINTVCMMKSNTYESLYTKKDFLYIFSSWHLCPFCTVGLMVDKSAPKLYDMNSSIN